MNCVAMWLVLAVVLAGLPVVVLVVVGLALLAIQPLKRISTAVLVKDDDPQLNATRAGVLAGMFLVLALGPTGKLEDQVGTHTSSNAFMFGAYVAASLAVIGQLYWGAKAAILCAGIALALGTLAFACLSQS